MAAVGLLSQTGHDEKINFAVSDSSGRHVEGRFDALATQQIAQHQAARERVIQMHLVDPSHHRQIGGRHPPDR